MEAGYDQIRVTVSSWSGAPSRGVRPAARPLLATIANPIAGRRPEPVDQPRGVAGARRDADRRASGRA